MYSSYPYYPCVPYAYYPDYRVAYVPYPYGTTSMIPTTWTRQQPVSGRATWTEGGPTTQCGIPWSTNEYMTVAVGQNSPYQCGQSIKVRNPAIPGREVIVTVVDKVSSGDASQITLHRRAFEALGANPDIGVLNVEIIADPELEEERWGKYLLEVVQTAYPNANVTEYNTVEKSQVSATETKETYDFILQSPEGQMTVRGNVVYNPQTNRVISFDLSEV
ncbi:DUF3889 domain-containing protein [Ornithinibacillus sp. L9]|uniref:DUF3889 domain-containing protein n=1 Tax=Ornithinibacillus caprae TaxID=2678566 RepID=A0A6N8FNK6_9BACI|nr:DUF3889 domain-containing protein [Ornithinibacillus caprae]MUK90406.1 DUF3889 domain-containing protein [Ornithinibacillus caprae]